MTSIPTDGSSVYEEMGFSLAASVFGGIIIVPIFSCRALPYFLSSKIILGINVCARLFGLAAMIYMVVCLVFGRRDWVVSANHSTVRRIRLGFLWVFCVLKCTTSVTHMVLLIICLKGDYMPSSVIAVLQFEVFTLVPYVFIQMGFITYTGRYTFYNLTSVKCVTFIVALSNIIEGATSLSRHISEDMMVNDSVSMYNCSLVFDTPGRRFAEVIEVFKTPISVEFSILATTLVLALRSGSEWTLDINYVRLIETSKYFWRRIAMVSNIIISVIVNLMILITGGFWVVWPDDAICRSIHKYTMLAQKNLAFVHVLIIHHCLFKRLNLQIRNTMLSFSDVSLLISAAAVSGFIAISKVIISLDAPFFVFNLLFIFYQTNFLLYGRRITYAGVDSISSNTLKGSFAILIGINMTSWFNDSFYMLLDISRWKPIPLIKDNIYILYMIYPFLGYYRFQASMELLEFYRKM